MSAQFSISSLVRGRDGFGLAGHRLAWPQRWHSVQVVAQVARGGQERRAAVFVTAVTAEAAGHGDVKLSIEVGPVTDSPSRRLAVKAAEKMVAAQELIQNDPLVLAMVRDFGAKIVPGSIQLI